MSVERAAIKKAAEDAGEFWAEEFGDEIPTPSTILALLVELEQAERERELTRVELKQSCEERERLLATERTKLATSEAALRTLRQASARAEKVIRIAADIDGMTEVKKGIFKEDLLAEAASLAAALAAEGGK